MKALRLNRYITYLLVILLAAPYVACGQSGTVKKKVLKAKRSAVMDSSASVYNTVDVPAKFPGGDGEWRKFLERNLNRDLPVENGAPPGSCTVVVSFTVSIDGDIADVKAENNPGYGVAEDAVSLIKKGPKWIPAMRNGKYVASRQRISIVRCFAEE